MNMRFFEYKHLPDSLMGVSKLFHDVAVAVVDSTPEGAEQSACLRKLMEAKDCAVRAKRVQLWLEGDQIKKMDE